MPDGTWRYPSRPAGEVTSWIIVCDCGSSSGSTATWLGPELVRVPSAALEDLQDRRIHAVDAGVRDVFHRKDVEAVVADLWRSEHLFTVGTLDDVAAAAAGVHAARACLDGAVAMARNGGASWADIGRATGMSRQSAQERWRTTSPGPRSWGVVCRHADDESWKVWEPPTPRPGGPPSQWHCKRLRTLRSIWPTTPEQ